MRLIHSRWAVFDEKQIQKQIKMLPKADFNRTKDAYIGPTSESNWLIPGSLMVGAYPADVDDEITCETICGILHKGITTFVCLQAEYDNNATEDEWKNGTKLRPYMEDVQYLMSLDSIETIISSWEQVEEGENEENSQTWTKPSNIDFIHLPIVDCKGDFYKIILIMFSIYS